MRPLAFEKILLQILDSSASILFLEMFLIIKKRFKAYYLKLMEKIEELKEKPKQNWLGWTIIIALVIAGVIVYVIYSGKKKK